MLKSANAINEVSSYGSSRGKFYLNSIGRLQRSRKGENLAYSANAEKFFTMATYVKDRASPIEIVRFF